METRTTVDIDAAPGVVWGVMTEIERWPEWTKSITRIQRLDPGPLRAGSRARIKQPGFPPTVWLVTRVEEGQSFTWVARSPGARVTARHHIAPRDGGSRVTLSLHYAGRLGPLLGRLTRRVTERYLGYEARGLKDRSEERMREAAGSPWRILEPGRDDAPGPGTPDPVSSPQPDSRRGRPPPGPERLREPTEEARGRR